MVGHEWTILRSRKFRKCLIPLDSSILHFLPMMTYSDTDTFQVWLRKLESRRVTEKTMALFIHTSD